MAYKNNNKTEIVKKQPKLIVDSDSYVRSQAMKALDEMKKLESKKRKKLVAVRIDSKTTIYATPERAEYILKELNKSPLHRGGIVVDR